MPPWSSVTSRLFRYSRKPRTVEGDGPPHLHARVAFENFFGGLAEMRRTWQTVAMLSLLINVILVLGFAGLAQQQKVVPYIVEVDALGEARSVGRIARADIPERAIVTALRRFVHNLRTIPTDRTLLNVRLNEARAFVAGNAQEAFLQGVQGERETLQEMLRRGDARYVEEINSVLRVPGAERVYRVTWRERARSGPAESEQALEGYFRLQLLTPESEDALRANPFGVYVTDYTISALTSQTDKEQ